MSQTRRLLLRDLCRSSGLTMSSQSLATVVSTGFTPSCLSACAVQGDSASWIARSPIPYPLRRMVHDDTPAFGKFAEEQRELAMRVVLLSLQSPAPQHH